MAANPRFLHDALYQIVEEVCWDADYLYRSFTLHFSELMGRIYGSGGSSADGSYVIPGIKSGLEATLRWHLEHRLDFHGPNGLRLDYRIAGDSGAVTRGGSLLAEIGTGRLIEAGPPPGTDRGPRGSAPR